MSAAAPVTAGAETEGRGSPPTLVETLSLDADEAKAVPSLAASIGELLREIKDLRASHDRLAARLDAQQPPRDAEPPPRQRSRVHFEPAPAPAGLEISTPAPSVAEPALEPAPSSTELSLASSSSALDSGAAVKDVPHVFDDSYQARRRTPRCAR